MKSLLTTLLLLSFLTPLWAGRDLDGIDDKIVVTRAAVFEPTGAVSIWCWMKRDGAQKDFTKIFGKTVNDNASAPFVQYMFDFNAGADDDVRFSTGHADSSSGIATSGANITDNTWFFLGGSYSDANDRVRLFYAKDGNALTKVETAVTNGVLEVDTTDDVIIGNKGLTGQEYSGEIAECGISNVELTANEFEHIRSKGSVGTRGAVGCWPLWGTASPEADLCGGGHNGTVTGAVRSNHAPVGPYR